jgi:hypothetical protein
MEEYNLVKPRLMSNGHCLEDPYQEMPRRLFKV